MGDVELSGLPQRQPAPSMISSAEFVVGFRDDVLPVLDFFESSRSLAGNLPDSWFAAIDSGMIEQALARNDLEPAAALIRKYMERPLKIAQTWPERIGIFRQGWEQALGLSQRPQHGAGALGWLARIHNLLSPASLREPGPDRRSAHLAERGPLDIWPPVRHLVGSQGTDGARRQPRSEPRVVRRGVWDVEAYV